VLRLALVSSLGNSLVEMVRIERTAPALAGRGGSIALIPVGAGLRQVSPVMFQVG
jgi:hypothetical protein